ncbi:MAG: type II secretion system major pseudopilin GspG [Candidatus Omnitrophota bacterium]|jgi:general secretion pathway protein G|nr:type II secretion system major pseudopilin GspG [Candidatus Omnitrophota bacterium]
MKIKGFTLIELIVVIAIITILAGMVLTGAQQARKRGAMTKAKAQIASIETAISMYEVDIGAYPDSGNKNLVMALAEDNGDPDWSGPYMKIKDNELKDGEYLDAWGTPFIYENPGTHNDYSYDIYSQGPNRKGSGEDKDDITNW